MAIGKNKTAKGKGTGIDADKRKAFVDGFVKDIQSGMFSQGGIGPMPDCEAKYTMEQGIASARKHKVITRGMALKVLAFYRLFKAGMSMDDVNKAIDGIKVN